MARRGPQSKNPAVRQRRNAELRALPGDRIDLTGAYPASKPAWLKVTRESWDTFWGSELAGSVRAKDVPALSRLFHLRNLHERLFREVQLEPLVEGSRKQDVLNPAAALMTKLWSEIRALEREFGLTPDAGARMVGQAATAQRSVRDLLEDGDGGGLNVVAVDSDTGT